MVLPDTQRQQNREALEMSAAMSLTVFVIGLLLVCGMSSKAVK